MVFKVIAGIIFLFICMSPQEGHARTEYGKCSYYSSSFEGKKTASLKRFSNGSFQAAHKSLPFGTIVQVMNRKNKKKVLVKIVDRGPYVGGRVIDLSQKAFLQIASKKEGIVEVCLKVLRYS